MLHSPNYCEIFQSGNTLVTLVGLKGLISKGNLSHTSILLVLRQYCYWTHSRTTIVQLEVYGMFGKAMTSALVRLDFCGGHEQGPYLLVVDKLEDTYMHGPFGI